MKREFLMLRRLVGTLMALVILGAMPLVTGCSDSNDEPDPQPTELLPADAGSISQRALEDGRVELSIEAIERATSYRWYKDAELIQNASSLTYIATESGRYKVAGLNSKGEGKASAELQVTISQPEPEQLPADAGTITQTAHADGTVELSVEPIDYATSYRWYEGDNVVQENELPTYLATKSGSYKVAGVNKHGEGKASEPCTVTVTIPVSVSVEATKLAFNDIQIEVKITGVEGYYAGNVMTEAFVAEDILENVTMMPQTTQTNYTGSLTEFPESSGETILPGISYTVWILLPKSEGEYTAADMKTFEFKAPNLSSGGTVQVTAGTPYTTQTEVEVDLSASGAYAIYFHWLTPAQMDSYTDQASKVALLQNSTQFEGGSATAFSGTTISLEPESDVWLLAMAIDDEGRYGEIFEQKYTTLPAPKNFTLTIDEANCDIDETEVTMCWTTTDGEAAKTVYYFAAADDPFWLNQLGESVESAVEFIIINPSQKNFQTTTASSVKLTGLTEGKRYIFVAVAFDANDKYSLGDGMYVTPQSKVTYVPRYMEDGSENPDWVATCPTIIIQDYCFVKGQLTRLFWMVDMVDGTTGYTAAISASAVKELYSSTKALAQDIMINSDYCVYYWVPDDPNIPDPNHELGGGHHESAKSTMVYEDRIYYHPYGSGDMKVYVTWKDAQGRLYEPVTADMPVIEAE